MNREGWVPIRFLWNGGDAQVDWCRLGGARFVEPFFDHTMAAAQRTPFNGLFTHRTPIAELGAWCEASAGMEPAGLIFHMSRCGSTLLSQMLAAVPENVVISEAAPVDRVARAGWMEEETRGAWLRWMVSALGQKRSGCETRYFVKFDSPTVVALPFIRRVYPGVPWIFVYRHPEEVLVSHLRQPAAAMSLGMITDVNLVEAPLGELVSMGREEYAARAIGRMCACAVAGMDALGMPVNYTQLPEALWGGVGRHFGIQFSAGETQRMQEAALYHAKRPGESFVPDGDAKRLEISEVARAAAARWIGPWHEQLERLRKARV